MTETPSSGTPQRRTLRRAKQERLLFGVCGGFGAYFNVDPTIVRVAFVLAGLIPPIGGTLALAYAALVFIIPVDGTDEPAGREQVRDNVTGLRREVASLAETVRERVTGEPRDAGAATPTGPTPSRDDTTASNETRAA